MMNRCRLDAGLRAHSVGSVKVPLISQQPRSAKRNHVRRSRTDARMPWRGLAVSAINCNIKMVRTDSFSRLTAFNSKQYTPDTSLRIQSLANNCPVSDFYSSWHRTQGLQVPLQTHPRSSERYQSPNQTFPSSFRPGQKLFFSPLHSSSCLSLLGFDSRYRCSCEASFSLSPLTRRRKR
jgi:hypothetical protein